ncbi:hypothetical protein ACIQU3_11375 [Streptomyces sp. NPDC101110]|uniref:hypothetical protein n=1 Tax=unclassified Streptomyces TaxID=2593676 RepID=UPI00382994FF
MPCARIPYRALALGLAVGAEPRIGPLATACVLILVVLGTLAARWTEPLAHRVVRRPGHRTPAAHPVAGPAEQAASAHP